MTVVRETKEVKRPGLLAEIGIARVAAVSALLIVGFAFQTTVLTRATLLGVIPQVLLVVILSLAFTDGERVGVVAGFFGGLLIDLRLEDPSALMGLTALIYTIVGYGVGSVRRFTTSESVWMPVFVVAIASAIVEASYAGLSIILGQQWVSLAFTAKAAGLVVLYNTLLTPFIFPVVRRVAERFRPERVYRW
ncbi:MAG: rod shape-determining protein MreD [Actinomycetota bacterium]|nr:rod shape-determining protein MreD [Actinomycetota bacterium]